MRLEVNSARKTHFYDIHKYTHTRWLNYYCYGKEGKEATNKKRRGRVEKQKPVRIDGKPIVLKKKTHISYICIYLIIATNKRR